MAKPVPAVQRAIRILRLLGRRPTEPWSLSEIADETGMNLSTCHSIAMELTDAGFLLRHDRAKTYTLGPALLEFATLASQQYLGLSVIHDEISTLSLQHDVAVAVGSREGDEIIVVAHHDASWGPPNTRTGFRSPLSPPLGVLFMAWEDDRQVLAWLGRSGPGMAKADVERYRDALEQVRTRGYWVALGGTLHESILRMTDRLAGTADREQRMRILAEMADAVDTDDYAVARLTRGGMGYDMVGVPVFGADGQVVYTITAMGRPGQFTEPVVRRVSHHLLGIADKVESAIGGQPSRSPGHRSAAP